MTISPNFDWSILSTLLSPIPGDIKFKVVDKEDGLETTLDGHKIILALHSEYFKNAFFGTGVMFKEQEEGTMVIKDTTKEAFEDFLGFNYEKKIEFEKKTLRELFEILNLAEKYQVKELKDRVSEFIENFTDKAPLTIHNVVDVAATAQEFYHFDNLSKALFARCVAFVGSKFSNAQSILNFVQGNEDKTTVLKLLQDVENPGLCTNCRQEPCRNKSKVRTCDPLEPGMVLLARGTDTLLIPYDCGVEGKYRNKLCKVVSRANSKVTITLLNPPDAADENAPHETYLVDHFHRRDAVHRFSYACDK